MRINHITLLVKDKQKAEDFYTKVLGFDKKESEDYLWIKIGDQYIHITDKSGRPVKNTFYHFAIEVDDLFEYVKKIRSRGADVFDFSKSRLQSFIKDPDGNLIEFIDTKDNFFK